MIQFLASLPAAGANSFYAGNRPPLLASPLIKLPIGAIRPSGWLQEQLRLLAEGFPGHLAEISKYCLFAGSAWASASGLGNFGWEELPYWLKGYTSLGYALGDSRIIAAIRPWIEGVLSSQAESGYFGPRANWEEKHDLWPNMVMLQALRTHCEATGDERIPAFMTRYCRWLTTIPLEQYLPGSWQKWRGGENLDSIYWLYNRSGESWLLDLARLNHERTADWTDTIPSWHGVNICQCFREPAQYYQQTHDRRYLQAALRNYETVISIYGQAPGGMFGADENARPGYTGPRQGAETCSIVEFMNSFQMLLRITGDALWADRCEEVAFNTLPAALTPDGKGLHYLTAPNQIQLDRGSKAPLIENDGDMFSYNPWQYRCCQHNVAFGWPYLAENLWLATQGDGLAAAIYAPCSVQARVAGGAEVAITEKTDYPFAGTVDFVFRVPRPLRFPLHLRLPGWCERGKLLLNGKTLRVFAAAGGWIRIERAWKSGDILRLELQMKISVRVWEKNRSGVSVHHGPLAYSLKIAERWQRYGESAQWPGYEVFPASSWNYGLEVDPHRPEAAFRIVRRKGPLAAQPFTPETAPIQLRAKARALPDWKQETNGLVGELPGSPAVAREPLVTVTLIPMGCARLRISLFPRLAAPPKERQ